MHHVEFLLGQGLLCAGLQQGQVRTLWSVDHSINWTGWHLPLWGGRRGFHEQMAFCMGDCLTTGHVLRGALSCFWGVLGAVFRVHDAAWMSAFAIEHVEFH